MGVRSVWRPTKDEVESDQGAVVTSHPLASEAGIEVLRQGGNAVDAAIAMGFCLAVVEPMGSGIAGHGQMLIHMVDRGGKGVSLDYCHRAPRAATANMYKVLRPMEEGNGIYEVEAQANLSGYLSVGVPGVAAGMCKAHELFGTLPLEKLLEPAIHYAEQGFQANWLTTLCIAEAMGDFVQYGAAARVFLPTGYPPLSDRDRVVQRDLGQTLRRIARRGRDGFHRGEIPQAIEEDMKKHGGLLRVADLTDYQVDVAEPARVSYRGHEVLGVATPSGSTTALQTFKILENFDLSSLAHNSPDYLHLLIEAVRHAFADRYRHLGDPDFGPVPLRGILSPLYAREIAAKIDRKEARLEGRDKRQPWVRFAEETLHDPWRYHQSDQRERELLPSPPAAGTCTTHFGAIDKNRNLVSCTQTLGVSFGSRVLCSGTGLLFSNSMSVFNPLPGAANSIAGYKRGLANMTPLLVLRDGKPFLSVGAPGGRRIISCNVQVVLNVLEHHMSIQEAIAAPRIDASGRETCVDSRMGDSIVTALEKMGHRLTLVKETAALRAGFARPLGLMVNPATGRIHAGVDVFGLAEARGL